MSVHDRKIKSGTIVALVGSSALIIISIITFTQQVPALSQSRALGVRAYDQEYVPALRRIGDSIPKNETLVADDIYPQAIYFTDHKVKSPRVASEKGLVQFMWKNNCSYLVVPEYTYNPPDITPLLIQLVNEPFERISDFYAQHIAVPKPHNNTPPLNSTSVLRPDNNNNTSSRLDLQKSIKGEVFNKLFEKISDYNTQFTILHLYKLRSDVTPDNLSTLTDKTRPILSVSLPINDTVMQSRFGTLRLNVTGTAMDAESKIKRVEISIDGLPFELANPRAPNDWSTWSFSDIVKAHTKTIVVRATDNADNRAWVPIHITVK